jgi:hypothetical protein
LRNRDVAVIDLAVFDTALYFVAAASARPAWTAATAAVKMKTPAIKTEPFLLARHVDSPL